MRRPFHPVVLRDGFALCVVSLLLAAPPAGAQSASPGARADEQFSIMKLLTEHDLHDIDDERWNAYGQFTYISSWKARFPALYTDANGSTNSLMPTPERSFTGTA